MSPGSHVSLDFGVEVGGLVSFNIASNSTLPVSLAFAESPSFVRSISDDTGATPSEDWDLALNVSMPAVGETWYQTPSRWFRGGFRFLTINALTDVRIWNVSCEVGFAPHMQDLRDYAGYFHTTDKNLDVLNRIWYAGAYTVQTNIAPQDTGRYLPQVRPGWAYNASLSVAAPVLLDGAKRDRAVWPGDLGVSGTTAFLTLGGQGLEAVANALETIFYYQNASTGEFPFAGPDTASFRSGSQSDTYHAWSLITMRNYALFSGDQTWLDRHWSNISRGVEFIVGNLDAETGLQNQTQTNDWGRQGGGGFNSVLNALDYAALTLMAGLTNTTMQSQSWTSAAERLKTGYNSLLWDEISGLYRDNGTTSLHPQDGNAFALYFNLTQNATQASRISQGLTKNWNAIGPVTPELPDTISPFVSGIEVLAHFRANEPARGEELMRRLWTYLLDSPLMTGSTIAEGITANGSLHYRSMAGYNHDAAYTSLSHSWSTAPVQALIFEMLGLSVTSFGGKTWSLEPKVVGNRSLEGGFETAMGRFDVGVAVARDGKAMKVSLRTPKATEGKVVVPSGWRRVDVDGKACTDGRVQGGKHEITFFK